MNNQVKDKLHLEKVILNSIDRSLGRYKAILEYVKKNAKIKHWKSERTDQKVKILSLILPTEKGHKEYRVGLDYPDSSESQAQEKIAKQIFNNF